MSLTVGLKVGMAYCWPCELKKAAVECFQHLVRASMGISRWQSWVEGDLRCLVLPHRKQLYLISREQTGFWVHQHHMTAVEGDLCRPLAAAVVLECCSRRCGAVEEPLDGAGHGLFRASSHFEDETAERFLWFAERGSGQPSRAWPPRQVRVRLTLGA